MDPNRWQRVCALFDAARAVEGADRDALLAGSPELADEVRELLGHHEDPTGALDATLTDPHVGGEIGAYRIVRVLGKGGMGTVYAAEGPDGAVALKRLHPQLKAEASIWERFQREAALGSRIRHPNVVQSFGIDAEDCIVMELADGETLEALLEAEARLPETTCRDIAREIGRALMAIHAAGAVHRDLKPSNVIRRSDGRIQVMDLGIALPVDDLLRLSATGQFVGTARYCAPEQLAEGKPTLDGRADLYALGLLLYEMAAGEHPIPRGGLVTTMRAHLSSTPRPLAEQGADVTPFFAALVHTLLAKDPAARLPDAETLVRVLDEGEAGAWWRAQS
ncbi:MAG: serine/threonine-protein kinase [Planctomycetota bacterium]|nr:serine/threonine-protein kinase [Planctomycetota bacterium]